MYFNSYKILAHQKEIDNFIVGKEVHPITVELDPTNLCNHNCFYCVYQAFRQECYCTLSQDITFKLIDSLHEIKTKGIVISGGGEPLIHPDIVNILNFIDSKQIDFGVVTNASLLHNTIRETLVKSKHAVWIRISLDAGTNETYNEIHKPNDKDDFEKVISNISELVYARIHSHNLHPLNIGVSFLVNKINFLEIPQVYNLCKELGVDYLQIKPVIANPPVLPEVLELSEKMISYLDRKKSESKLIVSLFRFNEVKNNNYHVKEYNKCLYSNFVAAVGPDGYVYPCCNMVGDKKFVLGDLNNQCFSDIWFSKQRQDILNSIDIKLCPVCRGDPVNKILHSYIKGEIKSSGISYPHKNFI